MRRRTESRRAELRRFIGGLTRVGALLLIVVAVLTVWSLVSGHDTGPSPEVSSPDEPFVVVTKVAADALEIEATPGDVADLSAREATALCWTHYRYREHMSLDANVRVLAEPGLLRSAELLAGPYRNDAAAAHAEAAGAQLGTWDVAAILGTFEPDDGWTEEDVDRARRYLDDRRDPPSAGAQEAYVAFEVSFTLSSRLVVRLRIGEIVNSDAPTNRNTAIYGKVSSPDRDVPILLERGELNRVCETVSA